MIHSPQVGQEVLLWTGVRWVVVTIVRVFASGIVELRAEETLGLQRGVSGAPAFFLIGRPQ